MGEKGQQVVGSFNTNHTKLIVLFFICYQDKAERGDVMEKQMQVNASW